MQGGGHVFECGFLVEKSSLLDGVHNTDNTLSLCGFSSPDDETSPMLNMAFNRLVDPAKVESVDVVATDVLGPDDSRLLDKEGVALHESEWPTKTVTYQ